MTQVICHDLNEVWDDISEFLDQENFRCGEVSRLAFSPLETPTVAMLTRAPPRVHDQPVREPPITLAMPPPSLACTTFASSAPLPPPSRPFLPSTCALASMPPTTSCSLLPTTSAVSTVTSIPAYYAPQQSLSALQPSMPIKEESPPSSPEIPYTSTDSTTYSPSPLANSLPDLNMPVQRIRKASRYFYTVNDSEVSFAYEHMDEKR
ncbi:unnamed protein product [Strongylus vulgaris]|uniref:Uncharacterized protein n=1 Tax=Strongylus vulgaris TaxID=40348 RepID=A0A3P7ICK6_STRVU|nr:unnamed protein product [Strongylus vulgaris]